MIRAVTPCKTKQLSSTLNSVLQVIRFAEEIFDVRLAFLSHYLRGNTCNMPAEAVNTSSNNSGTKMDT